MLFIISPLKIIGYHLLISTSSSSIFSSHKSSIILYNHYYYSSSLKMSTVVNNNESSNVDTAIDEILDYWLGPLTSSDEFPGQRIPLWFYKNIDTDNIIKSRFEPLLLLDDTNQLAHWSATPRGRLAHIILLDQFTRNIYRNMPQAFAKDAKCLQLALEGIALGHDQALTHPVERMFFYLPLEHSEDIAVQNVSLEQFNKLVKDFPNEAVTKYTEKFYQYAKDHYVIIERFNRYPHRNAILGRESTAEEEAFLAQPGSSF